ncbi:MAG TPA: glycosyltransferase [Humibacter sp.]|nr:glycosyltransferase [Humibacter sp.]
MRILVWHVHGGWMDSFVRGRHEYLIPTTAARDAWGLGRSGRDWPPNAIEVAPDALASEQIDAVVLQRPEEIGAVQRLTGRAPGTELPAVYLEHNTPKGEAVTSVHPLAERNDILLVHVTHFNRLIWDNGFAPTTVIEHGIPDPGERYSGDEPSIGVVVNEPVRRWRVTGTDLLPAFARVAPLDVFGMRTDLLPAALELPPRRLRICGDLPPDALHAELARRRVYLHPVRWTSLGLSLLEAMLLGMPVLALATTEAVRAVPPEAGAISTDPGELVEAARTFIHEPDEARRRGAFARRFAVERYGLDAFLRNWDEALERQVAARRHVHALSAQAPAAHRGHIVSMKGTGR